MDVTAISSAFFPHIDRRYAILASGASVGRGYGPARAVRPGERFASLVGRRVAIPGATTTGALLLRYFYVATGPWRCRSTGSPPPSRVARSRPGC